MIKRTLLILSLLLPVLALAAPWKGSDVKMWNEGALAWSDFKGAVPQAGDAAVSRFEGSLDAKRENTRRGSQYFAYAFMDRYRSFVSDTATAGAARLRYHQLQFDVLEVTRRLLQSDLLTVANDQQAQERVEYYRAVYKEQLLNIDEETSRGTDTEKLAAWEYFTQKNLEQNAVPDYPREVPSDLGIGLSIGVGGIFPMNDINDTFEGNFKFGAGLIGQYRRLQLQANVGYGQPGLSNRNVFGEYDDADRPLADVLDNNASRVDVSLSLGYSVVATSRFAITPHVGLYWAKYKWNATRLKWIENEETGEYESSVEYTTEQYFKDLNWMAGIDFDIKLHTATSEDEFWFGRREQLTSMLRITPYVARAVLNNENPSCKGYFIGFTVSYFGLARALGLE